ncbi:MAG: hypothetical protein SFU56_01970 [Capsulimonadales bacterium]|nr:hypothetical protein [Capsulimonadales bacterium]
MHNTETGIEAAENPRSRELRLLLDELRAADVEAALAAIRRLKAEAEQVSGGPDPEASGNGPTDARKMLEKFRAFSSRIDSLNGTIASMEEQLRNLYADRERLEQEIGASEVSDVIAAFAHSMTTIELLEAQLATLYADREYLETELGKSEATDIVSMFRNVTTMVQTAHKELVA